VFIATMDPPAVAHDYVHSRSGSSVCM